MFDNASA